jgi:ATP-binding cassette subfamily C protein CydD
MQKPPGKALKQTAVRWLQDRKPLAGRALTAAIGLGLLSGFLLIVQARFLAKVVCAVVIDQKDLSFVTPWLLVLLGIFAIRAVLARLSEETAFLASARVKEEVRSQLFRHLQDLGPAYLYGKRSGEVTTAVVDAVEALEPYYSKYLPQTALAALIPFSILAFVLPSDWQSAVVLMITGPLIPLFMALIGKGAERLNRKQWRKLARMSAHFLDVLQGLTTLKLFNVSRREARVVAQISDDYRHSTMSVLRVAFLSSLSLEFFSTISIALVAVWLGFRLLWRETDIQCAFFVLLLAPEFFLPLRRLGANYHARMEAIGAVQGIIEVLNTAPPPGTDGARQVTGDRMSSLELDNILYSYDGRQTALDGVSLTIAEGEAIALVGASGAGKSTVANLLLGFIRPQSGTIKVNGISLDEIPREHWLSKVAWVPQRPRLFHGTVSDNIRLGNPAAGMAEITEAARLAQAQSFVEELPAGYETVLGEGGRILSGGQRQLMAISRAFLKDAPLVILDEATANLDPSSQDLVQSAIYRLAKGRMMIMIAHRLSTIRQVDRIVVMDRGRIVEQGSHGELLGLRGFYSRMVRACRGEI